MIVTEENARHIACPFAASFNAGHGRQYFKDGYSKRETDHATCIGAACMAWDWIDNDRVMPQNYLIGEDGTGAAAGVSLRQGYLTLGSSEHTPETKEEWHERITKVRTEEGFTRNEKFAVDSVTGWWKPHPQRRGQCGRTPIIEISQG